jgi:hypothetical protein
MSTKIRSKTAQKEFDKFISRLRWQFMSSLSTSFNAQHFISTQLGIHNCGCTMANGVDPYEIHHFYGDIDDSAEDMKEYAKLKKECVSVKDSDGDEFFYKYTAHKDEFPFLFSIPGYSDSNVVFLNDTDAYKFFDEPSTLALEAIEHFKELGMGMEALYTGEVDAYNKIAVVRLTGDGWLNKGPAEKGNQFLTTGEETTVSYHSYEDLIQVLNMFTVRKDPVEFFPPLISHDSERGQLGSDSVWIPATNELFRITALPKEGIVHKNCELFSELGHFLKYPHSLKDGRKLTESITDPLTDFQREALRTVHTSEGNIPGAVIDITEQVQEATKKLELLKKTQEFLAAGDFSVIELAALEQISTCSKLVAHSKLDKRITDIAKKILTMR